MSLADRTKSEILDTYRALEGRNALLEQRNRELNEKLAEAESQFTEAAAQSERFRQAAVVAQGKLAEAQKQLAAYNTTGCSDADAMAEAYLLIRQQLIEAGADPGSITRDNQQLINAVVADIDAAKGGSDAK